MPTANDAATTTSAPSAPLTLLIDVPSLGWPYVSEPSENVDGGAGSRRRAGTLDLAPRLPRLARRGRLAGASDLDVRRKRRRGGGARPACAAGGLGGLAAARRKAAGHGRRAEAGSRARRRPGRLPLRRAGLRAVAVRASEHPADGARADRARLGATGRVASALRRARPQRDAALAAGAAQARLRGRADRRRRRAAHLGDTAHRPRPPSAARAAGAAVRARGRLARRAGSRPRGLRASARAAGLERVAATAAAARRIR